MTRSYHIRLDRPRCIGAENCARYAPRTFDLEDGQVVLLPEPHDDAAALEAAAAACPMQVIHLEPDTRAKETAA